jgi:recombinational DNA repair ATPase RecF
LAQNRLVAEHLRRPTALLVDEPAADLDREHLALFVGALERSPAQVFIASLAPDELLVSAPATVFHVEHSGAKALL